MFKIRLTILSILTLGVCSFVNAEEYKAPEVKFKKTAFKQKKVVDTEVDDYYKFESQVKGHDRQIASEEAPKQDDRTPSAFKAHPTKEEAPLAQPVKKDAKPDMWYKDHHRFDSKQGRDFNKH